jgi:hypothetical protein
MVNGVNGVYINGHGYYIRWEVEGDYAPPPPHDSNGPIIDRSNKRQDWQEG